jgi:thymidine phosphorylase
LTVDAVEVIRAKRDGEVLTDEQIRWFLDSYTHGRLPDEQAAALLMAIVWRGMSPPELATWTAAMIESGERLDLSGLEPTVDKHSTGGVGDLVSLVLVPLVACFGARVPQMAGRGLGHTGGTLDKLEAVPGWRATLPPDELRALLADPAIGGVICAASENLAPADRKLYVLRDITATVESIPLIASSIMSKKIAEGTAALVLDVKVGAGAFMRDESSARQLAETMVGIGEANGVRTVALLTGMDHPLGTAAGNALEVREAVELLSGRGPADLRELTVALAREMLALAGVHDDPEPALDDGRAQARFERLVAAQGGELDGLPAATDVRSVPAPASGFVQRLDARAVGVASWRLGAGRARKEDAVSAVAGVRWLAGPGDEVIEGEPLFEVHVDDPARVDGALEALAGAVTVGPDQPERRPLIIDRIAT